MSRLARSLLVPSEHEEQAALIKWADFSYAKYPDLTMLYAIPNGGDRHKATAAALKAEGVVAGVPDLHLPVARGLYHGLYVEMKREGLRHHARGGRSFDQVAWHKALRNRDNAVCTCYGWVAASKAITAYLNGSFEMPDTDDCAFFGE
ncbi:VRR-NUC domain-containing protein [Breoghania corrubedonensis]|uniref:VRR-NUC domain-containing protein n=1 Tax=Breoghania corrubedonensis TaxID=665038 RepID=A0A2T5UQ10_9HYPH|nr:VRR-NUC domain-containing protein [Breoghania corrubedonensis]PTW53583.1 VRR-NUC domain-containing protein [Breoghania corrubedonensis]